VRIYQFVTLALLIFSSVARADSYFVGTVTTSDGDQELTQSVRSLETSSVTSAGGTLAEADKADYVLRSDVVKLGPSYVLTVSKIKDGKVVYISKQKAATIQDMDEAADRAVRAAMVGTPTKKDLRVGEVKENQKNEMRNRIESKNSVYAGFGPAYFQNMGVTMLSYDFALGYNWGVSPFADIKVLADLVMSGDWRTSFLSGLLGLNIFFTDENSAPYVTGGLGFGASGSSYSSATTIGGFDGNLGLGWEFFRTSSTQFDVCLSYTSIFGNNTIGAPAFYSLRLGILF